MAGAGFKTFNTGDVLTASDVNTYLMQQTVMVFDDASARSTALPTPSEGMFSYLKDTNLTYRYDGSAWLSDAGTTSPLTTKGDVWGYSTADARIPVGADGTVLTADSAEALGVKWATAASGGYTLLSTTSLSGSSTSITSINQTYTDLYLWIYDLGLQTTNGTITLNFNSITTNIFGYALNDQGGAAGSANANIPLSLSQNINTGTNSNTWSVYISQYASGSRAPYTFSGNYYSGAWRGIFGGGGRESQSAITSVQVTTSAGTFSSGTIKIYGVK